MLRNVLKGLNPNKATCPDKISTKFLKNMANPVKPALTRIFQASINQGQPQIRNSDIFKKVDKSKPSNYRPVSLTSVCCKVVEHIYHSPIVKFLFHNRLPAWVYVNDSLPTLDNNPGLCYRFRQQHSDRSSAV